MKIATKSPGVHTVSLGTKQPELTIVESAHEPQSALYIQQADGILAIPLADIQDMVIMLAGTGK